MGFLAALTWWLWRRKKRPQKPTKKPDTAAPTKLDTVSVATGLPVQRIRFHANSSRLSVPAAKELDRLAQWLKANRVVIELTGSADASGNPASNRQVAKRRTAVALRALLAHGIDPSRIVSRTLEPQYGRTDAHQQDLRCVMFRETGSLDP